MLYWPSSRASEVIRPVTPCLEAAYEEIFSAPLSASVEPVKTIEPPSFCAIMVGIAALTVWNTPLRLMSTISRQSSGLISQVLAPEQMPALGSTMSTRPNCSTPRSKIAFT